MDELADLSSALTEWQGIDAKFKSQWDAQIKAENPGPSPTALITVFEEWSKGRRMSWAKLSDIFKVGKMPPLDAEIRAGLITAVTEYLREKTSPMRGAEPETWRKLIKSLGAPQTDTGVHAWLQLFSQMENKAEESTRKKAAERVMADKGCPQWLRHEAEALSTIQAKSAPKIDPMAEMAKAKAEEDRRAKERLASMEDADAPEAKNPIFICFAKPAENASGQVEQEVFAVEPGMHLFVGAAWDKHPRPSVQSEDGNGNLKKWLGETENGKQQFRLNFNSPLHSFIAFSNEGRITHLPDNASSAPDGYRLVARSSDDLKVLFDLRLIPAEQKGSRPVLTNTPAVSVIHSDKVTLTKLGALLERLHFAELADPQFLIRLDGAATEQKFYGITKVPGESSVIVDHPQSAVIPALGTSSKALENRIKELEEGIAKDQKDIEDNEKTKIPERIKSEKREKYIAAKSNKEIELVQVKQQKRTLESQTTAQPLQPFFTLPPGEYTLLERTSGNTMICKLLITAQDKASNSKPAQP